MNSLSKNFIFLLLCFSCAINGMQKKDCTLFLPPIDQKAQQEVFSHIEHVPHDIVSLFSTQAQIDELAENANCQEKNSPQNAILNYLHAAVLLGNSKDNALRERLHELIEKAISIAVKMPNTQLVTDYFAGAAQLSCKPALLGLGELYRCQKKFDKAEAAFRLSGSDFSYYLLGRMFAVDCPREFKARAYYLAAGKKNISRAYADLANMYARNIRDLKERGCNDQDLLKDYIEDAVKLYWLAGCKGSDESLRSVIGLSDYAERECNFSPSSKSIRLAAYKMLLDKQNVLPAIQQSFHQFVTANNLWGIESLPVQFVQQLRKELDDRTKTAVENFGNMNNEAAGGDAQSQLELAETIFCSYDPSNLDIIKAMKLYISALYGLKGDRQEQYRFVVNRLKSIADTSAKLRSELFFSILDRRATQLFQDVFEADLPHFYKGGIVEYIEQNHFQRLEDFAQKGNPLALLIDAVILNHRAALAQQNDGKHALMNQALNCARKAFEDNIESAKLLIVDISAQLSQLYREAHDYEKSFELLLPCLNKWAKISLSSDFWREYTLLCLEKPSYLVLDAMPALKAALHSMSDDFRAKCFVQYRELCKTYNRSLRTKCAYAFVQSILGDDNHRTYFFTHCPDFVKDSLRHACELHDPNACYVYGLLLLLTNKADDKAYEYVSFCSDQSNPWVKCMRAVFSQQSARAMAPDQLSDAYQELVESDSAWIRDYAFSALKKLALEGNVRACCDLFVLGCIKNDEVLFNQMFALIKENKVDQKAAINCFKEHAQEKLQQCTATNMKAAYIYALVQMTCAENCKEKGPEWYSFSRSAFDNFVHAHKGKHLCGKRIALIGCRLIDYYQQHGDITSAQLIKTTMCRFCPADEVSSLLIDILNNPKLSAQSAEIMIALLDELAVNKSIPALDFMGHAYAAGKNLPSGYSIQVDQEKALTRLNDLVKAEPNNYKACFEVAQLMLAKGSAKDQNGAEEINELLKKAMDGGISDAERLYLIMQLNDKRITEETRNSLLGRLKSYADKGDEEAIAILSGEKKLAEGKAHKRLLKIINCKNSTGDQISDALSRLGELAKSDKEIQFFLIDLYVLEKKLPSGFVCRHNHEDTLSLLLDYAAKEKQNLQVTKYLIKILNSLPDDVVGDRFEQAYAFLRSRREAGDAFDSDELYSLALICYKTHRFREALELYNAIKKEMPMICWLRALCYLHDESAGDNNFERALTELTKALVFDSNCKLLLQQFPEASFIVRRLLDNICPRSIALLCRLIFLANVAKSNNMEDLTMRLHYAAHADPCAQSLLVYLCRVGYFGQQSLVDAVELARMALSNPDITDELKKEVYAQIAIIVNEYFSKPEMIVLPLRELKIYVMAIYLIIPYLVTINPAKAIEYHNIAEANSLLLFSKDRATFSLSQSEFYLLDQSCGSYDALKQMAHNNDLAAIRELITILLGRYTAELKKIAENEKIVEVSREIFGYAESIKSEMHELIQLFIDQINDKSRRESLKRDQKNRDLVDDLFETVAEAMLQLQDPIEKVTSLLEQAIEFNPKSSQHMNALFELFCRGQALADKSAQNCIPLLEKYAHQNMEASLLLGQLYSPRFDFAANKFIPKDLEKSLKYLVQAEKLGSVEARELLQEASTLPLDVEANTVFCKDGSHRKSVALALYSQAQDYFSDEKTKLGLGALFGAIDQYKMPLAAMQAAAYFHHCHNENNASEMLIQIVQMTHGLLPKNMIPTFINMLVDFSESDNPHIQALVEKIGQCMLNNRKNLASKKNLTQYFDPESY